VNFSRQNDHTLFLAGLDAFLFELLRQLEPAATLGPDDPATGRFFPIPASEEERMINEDWREFVTPELRHLFEEALQTVKRDLESVEPVSGDPDKLGVIIPLEHADAWLNALNQARLALAERHRVTEEDMDLRLPLMVKTDRDFALLQIQFYGLVQELLVEAVS
jgi:hypothetical protein